MVAYGRRPSGGVGQIGCLGDAQRMGAGVSRTSMLEQDAQSVVKTLWWMMKMNDEEKTMEEMASDL